MKKSELKKIIQEEIKSTLNETQAQDDALEVIQKISLNFKSSQEEYIEILRTLSGTPQLANQDHDKQLSKMFMDYAKLRDAEAKIINNMYEFVTGTNDFQYEGE
tara:strand:+ start:114 stop:425 length:312 start_codon:yes stop_codon:yes gene_type:complete